MAQIDDSESGDTMLIRSAGGVVWRFAERAPDQLEVVLVHRPRYDDWSLPKGKLDPDEHPIVAAAREVEEEAGVVAVPQARLPTAQYLTAEPGVEKLVEYWSMGTRSARPRPADHELDGVVWLPTAEAVRRLTYAHDRSVLHAFTELAPVTSVVALVRHGRAGSRQHWAGPDAARPLDAKGERQAGQLAAILATLHPDRIHSASPDRCVTTVQPLAERLGLEVRVDKRFDEVADERAGAAALRRLSTECAAAVVCSQGGMIEAMIAELTGRDMALLRTRKGHGWLLAFAGSTVVALDLFSPAAPGNHRTGGAQGGHDFNS